MLNRSGPRARRGRPGGAAGQRWDRDLAGFLQTLINEALRQHIERQSGAHLETTLRRVLREELTAANP